MRGAHTKSSVGLILYLLASLLPVTTSASTELPTSLAVPGGVAILDVPGEAERAPAVTFDGNRVMVLPGPAGWRAIVGIPLARAPGAAAIEIRSGNAIL
ncbi:MAG: hypothetical protein FJ187_07620, partial [Gammaproteobacteria bacterium]|nr:hypothetical protein [Gammaproteobacteria bacterium]